MTLYSLVVWGIQKGDKCVFSLIRINGLPRWLSGKESTCSARDMGLIPGQGGSPGVENGNTLQQSCLENTKDREGMAGYSPWGPKESDMTEQVHTQISQFPLLFSQLINCVGKFARGRERDGVKYTGIRAFKSVPNDAVFEKPTFK